MTKALRADMHVHTRHSTECGTLRFLGSRDCYSKPLDVYRTAKARGMDLVAITDHDSIGGALELLERLPDSDDVIVGEEVSCWFPTGGIEVHLGVYEMTETLHRELQPLRRNVFDVIACLREAGVFFSLNHLFHFYRAQVPLADYLRLLDEVPALEARNGTMLAAHNELIERLAATWVSPSGARCGAIGGSDAHTLRRIGRTWTSAPGATRADFMASLQRGLGRPGGDHGSATVIAGDAYGVVARYLASLAGFGPRDHRAWRRAGCLAFGAVSLPFQFLPLVFAVAGKAGERREVARAAASGVLPLQLVPETVGSR